MRRIGEGHPAGVGWPLLVASIAAFWGMLLAFLTVMAALLYNKYKYDAWGRIISKTGSLASTLGTVQPFRYRGYVYEEETGLYYLRSR